MKIKHIIGMLFLTVLLTVCNTDKNWKQVNKESYLEFQNYFPEKLFLNFPTKIRGDSTRFKLLYPESIKHNFNYCGVFISYNLSDPTIDAEAKKYIKKISGIEEIKTNQIIKLKPKTEEKEYLRHKSDFFNKDSYLVPDYSNLIQNYSLYKQESFSDNIRTIIIDSKIGKFLPSEYLLDNSLFPDEIKHGYSKGIFIDKESPKVVFWLIVW